jgi:hypothetical protein
MSKVPATEQQRTQEHMLALWEKVLANAFAAGRHDIIDSVSAHINSIKSTIETLKFLQRPDVELRRKA